MKAPEQRHQGAFNSVFSVGDFREQIIEIKNKGQAKMVKGSSSTEVTESSIVNRNPSDKITIRSPINPRKDNFLFNVMLLNEKFSCRQGMKTLLKAPETPNWIIKEPLAPDCQTETRCYVLLFSIDLPLNTTENEGKINNTMDNTRTR